MQPQTYELPDCKDDEIFTVPKPSLSGASEGCLSVAVKPGLAPILLSSSKTRRQVPCMVTLTGASRSLEEIERERVGTDLVCVIDVSGSMHGTKLETAKCALQFIVENMGVTDRISLVTFSDNARRLCPLTLCTDTGRASLQTLIPSIHTTGGTNIEAGLRLGLKVLKDRRVINNQSALFLLSDGIDSTGGNALERCRQTLESGVRDGAGVLIHTFGFGREHDAALMSALAETGGGGFQYVETAEGISEAFARSFSGLVSIIARDITVKLQSKPDQPLTCVVSKLYTRSHNDFFSLPFITANDRKDLVFLLSVEYQVIPSPVELTLISVYVTYSDTMGREQRLETELSLSFVPNLTENVKENVDKAVYSNWYRVKGSEVLKSAQEFAEQGNIEAARTPLLQLIAEIERSEVKAEPLVSQMKQDVEQCLASLRNRQDYLQGGAARMSSLSSNHYYQYSSPTTSVYTTIQQTTYSIRSTEYQADYARSVPYATVPNVPFPTLVSARDLAPLPPLPRFGPAGLQVPGFKPGVRPAPSQGDAQEEEADES